MAPLLDNLVRFVPVTKGGAVPVTKGGAFEADEM